MSNSFPLVSIGVTSFNHENYILETLESVKNQTYNNFELIIVDDCSSDGSRGAIEKWISENPDLSTTFICHEENRGVCVSLNEIVNLSNGKYISLIASDDYYNEGFIYNRVKALEESDDDVGMCYSKTNFVNSKSEFVGLEERLDWPNGFIFEQLCHLNHSFCKPLTSMTKRCVYEEIGEYDENLTYEDLDFFFRLTQKFKVLFIEEVDTNYRISDTGLGSTINSTPKGLESTSAIVWKNFGFSKNADAGLAKRLRKLALKKRELKIESWKKDFHKSLSYTKSWKDRLFYFIFKHI